MAETHVSNGYQLLEQDEEKWLELTSGCTGALVLLLFLRERGANAQ
jgi:hypothetical protein